MPIGEAAGQVWSRMNVGQFIAKWSRADLKERSAAQEHFIDLCGLLSHPTPADADPTGTWFCFEKGAAKQGGGDGFADVWKKDFFGWEYKARHKDLGAAYDQLLLYRDALANPPLLVTCDLDRIVVHTNFTKTVSATHEVSLDRLGEARSLEILRAVFFDPEKLRPGKTSEAITQDAAQQPRTRRGQTELAWRPFRQETHPDGLVQREAYLASARSRPDRRGPLRGVRLAFRAD